ncbi:hypothetical protein [Povalibacter sp.]|uniref:hypothetical protein n=1 Tax=Povalibacter sp. TaxID=1962978 RepID=UPI002F3FC6F5
MIEKPEDEFDDDEDDAVVDTDDAGLDHLLDDLDKRKKSTPKVGEPALRRLERRREELETAAQLSDLDDYDIDEPGAVRRRRKS